MLLTIIAVLATWITISGCAIGSSANDVSRGEVSREGSHITLRGLWPYDGEISTAELTGILDIQKPCVYILDTFEGDIRRTAEGKPIRSFLKLPESLTRFDSTTDQIWVDDSGPMTSGDLVKMVGGIHGETKVPIEKTYEGVCVAHSSILAGSMRPWTWDPRELYPQYRKIQARALLKGLWPYDPKKNYNTVKIFGTLVLEEPCVYIELSLNRNTQLTVNGEPVRSFVRLPDTRTFYNSTTSKIWTSGTTPINNGEPILIHGTMSEPTTAQIYEGICLAHSETTAVSMGVWSGGE